MHRMPDRGFWNVHPCFGMSGGGKPAGRQLPCGAASAAWAYYGLVDCPRLPFWIRPLQETQFFTHNGKWRGPAAGGERIGTLFGERAAGHAELARAALPCRRRSRMARAPAPPSMAGPPKPRAAGTPTPPSRRGVAARRRLRATCGPRCSATRPWPRASRAPRLSPPRCGRVATRGGQEPRGSRGSRDWATEVAAWRARVHPRTHPGTSNNPRGLIHPIRTTRGATPWARQSSPPASGASCRGSRSSSACGSPSATRSR